MSLCHKRDGVSNILSISDLKWTRLDLRRTRRSLRATGRTSWATSPVADWGCGKWGFSPETPRSSSSSRSGRSRCLRPSDLCWDWPWCYRCKRDDNSSTVRPSRPPYLEAESFLAELCRLARLIARGGATGSLSFSSDLARDPPAWNFCVVIQWNRSIRVSANTENDQLCLVKVRRDNDFRFNGIWVSISPQLKTLFGHELCVADCSKIAARY